MSVEVKIPAVGESITSGVVSVWHKKSGDYVQAGDALFTLETDKVSTEITAEKAGVLQTKANEGQEVKIGEVVAIIDDSKTAPELGAKKEEPAKSAPVSQSVAEKPPLSPSVRRIVEEEKLQSDKISGSGKGGRLTKGDALAAAQARSAGATSGGGDREETTEAEASRDGQSQGGRIVRRIVVHRQLVLDR